MSGTNHSKADAWGGPQPTFILVESQMGENIGGAARAMWNFGLELMRLVNPRDGWPNSRAVAMASGAGRVLDQVQVYDTTVQATADLQFVYATTARGRDITKQVMTPEEAMIDARVRISKGQKVGVLFGPERAGLQKDDVARANVIISVPVNPAFASLNLAQCVLLTAYEWRRDTENTAKSKDKAVPASGIEVQKLAEHLEERLEASGFFWPDHKADSMIMNLRNMLSRMPFTDADIRTMHGIVRSLAERSPHDDKA